MTTEEIISGLRDYCLLNTVHGMDTALVTLTDEDWADIANKANGSFLDAVTHLWVAMGKAI